MHSHIFLDESGDLGFSFGHPMHRGGSSRYLTIGFILCPHDKCAIVKRLVGAIYKKFGFKLQKEKKATELRTHQKEFICIELVNLVTRYPQIQVGAITVSKQKVRNHIRQDPDKLYNHMIRLAILDKIETHSSCQLTRDERTVKTASENSCIDYLQSILWFDRLAATNLTDNPSPSHTNAGIILADWISNIVWSRYEYQYTNCFNTLSPILKNQTLFF